MATGGGGEGPVLTVNDRCVRLTAVLGGGLLPQESLLSVCIHNALVEASGRVQAITRHRPCLPAAHSVAADMHRWDSDSWGGIPSDPVHSISVPLILVSLTSPSSGLPAPPNTHPGSNCAADTVRRVNLPPLLKLRLPPAQFVIKAYNIFYWSLI